MINVNYDDIGFFIKKLRKERNLTIEELSKYIGVSKPAVSQWENGNGIRTDMLFQLSRFFNITVDELIAGKRKDETNLEYIKRNYDLSLFDFDENNLKEKTVNEYFSHLLLIKNRFFVLLKKWALDELNENSKEEFDFIRKYFEIDGYYLKFNYFDNAMIKKLIKDKVSNFSLEEDDIEWELQKFFSIKQEYLKLDLVFDVSSEYLLKKLFEVINQPEKDNLLFLSLKKEKKSGHRGGTKVLDLTKDYELSPDEIENNRFLKLLLDNGCNCMKQFENDLLYMDKEDLNHIEGKIYETEEIPSDFGLTFYRIESVNYYKIRNLSNWKNYIRKEYESLVDKEKTEFYKALVNSKNDDPRAYYDVLKKYYRG